jgi:GNAT superfamily N-acetyltransferase
MSERHFTIRQAGPSEIPAIRAMQGRSMRELGQRFYDADAIGAFLGEIGTMDDAVVGEGHYFVAADDRGAILGSGGWSRLRPSYARAADAAPDDAATIRSVFVDPRAARRGIGSAIMAKAEDDAARHGVDTLRLTATLSGVPLYARLGYRAVAPREIRLAGGARFACVAMEKRLGRPHRRAA